MSVAWIFPGQGSQAVGMGVDLAVLPEAASKLAEAEAVLGWSVLEKCQGGEEDLSRTLYTQPCLYVIESILVDVLQRMGQLPDVVAGHSLGEYVALYAAGVWDFTTGLELTKTRAKLMDEAVGGKMVALMKFDRPLLETLVSKTTDVVIANDNSSEQVVISGKPEAIDGVVEALGAKRAVALKVSGAFHSPQMVQASEKFSAILETVAFHEARIPVLSNRNPIPTTNANEIQQRLMEQMTGSVRWREIMLQLPNIGITEVVEVGPGKVLTGLIKRTCPELATGNIGTLADLGIGV